MVSVVDEAIPVGVTVALRVTGLPQPMVVAGPKLMLIPAPPGAVAPMMLTPSVVTVVPLPVAGAPHGRLA